MNKKIIIAVVVIVLLLLGTGAYVMSTKSKSTTSSIPTTNTQVDKVAEATSAVSQKSLKDLLTAGVPQKCTYKDVSNNVAIEGTTYILNGKVRADFSTTSEGKTSVGHTIFDGTTSYVWMEGTATGFKMKIDTSANTSSESSTQQGLDMNKSIDYNCSAWFGDQTLLEPPANVTFTTFTVPTGITPGVTSSAGTQNLCSTCNSLSGEQKTQCLTALKCN